MQFRALVAMLLTVACSSVLFIIRNDGVDRRTFMRFRPSVIDQDPTLILSRIMNASKNTLKRGKEALKDKISQAGTSGAVVVDAAGVWARAKLGVGERPGVAGFPLGGRTNSTSEGNEEADGNVGWVKRSGNYSALFLKNGNNTGGGGANQLRACYREIERIESVLFANLSWEMALAEGTALPHGSCKDAFAKFAQCGGPKAWEKGGVPSAGFFKSSPKAKVNIFTNNGTEAKLSQLIENPIVAWLGDVSVVKRKRSWQIAISGDSTIRGLTKSVGELFVGENLALLGGLARFFSNIRIEVMADDFTLTFYFIKNWAVTFANEAHNLLHILPHMDLFLWNVGQHAMWSPIPKGRVMKRPSLLLQGGFFAREALKLEELLPPWTRAVYVNTNSICLPNQAAEESYKLQRETPSEAVAYMFTAEGSKALNDRLREELHTAMKRPVRVIDSWTLTHSKCQYTTDGNHYLPLDRYKVLSILLELVV